MENRALKEALLPMLLEYTDDFSTICALASCSRGMKEAVHEVYPTPLVQTRTIVIDGSNYTHARRNTRLLELILSHCRTASFARSNFEYVCCLIIPHPIINRSTASPANFHRSVPT
jgi:hypothetical protein